QNYHEFEVVVVNDRSYDGTHDWLFEYEKQHEKLSFVSLNDDQLQLRPGKKFGLTMGIKKAKHEIVALIDADCRPISNEWLKHIGSQHSDTKKIVLGYSPYEPAKGVLNLFIRFEAFWVAWQYLSLAILGRPYMAVGRNLSYRKQLFFDNKGFANHMHIPFGDDDLLIQEIANAKNTNITIMEPGQILSKPKNNFRNWLQQKQRHLAASAHYRLLDKLLLGTIWFAQVAAFAILIIWIFSQPFAYLIPCLAFAILLLWTMLALVLQQKFKMFKAWYAFAFLQIVYQLILLPTFSLMGLLNPPKRKW
ncbi:MAG: glycosyltransferase, partial [Bacteroidetes bacterium]|nr:glycosyltransferase [Bacteroidota bacterium]